MLSHVLALVAGHVSAAGTHSPLSRSHGAEVLPQGHAASRITEARGEVSGTLTLCFFWGRGPKRRDRGRSPPRGARLNHTPTPSQQSTLDLSRVRPHGKFWCPGKVGFGHTATEPGRAVHP